MILRERQTCLCLYRTIPHNLTAILQKDFYYPIDNEIVICKDPCWFPERGNLYIWDDVKYEVIPYFRKNGKLYASCGSNRVFRKGSKIYYLPSVNLLEFLKLNKFCQIFFIFFQTIPMPVWVLGKIKENCCITLFSKDLRLLKPESIKYEEEKLIIKFEIPRSGYAVFANTGQIRVER